MASFLAAPIASMFLADFGADVIKIERPGIGDELRYWGHDSNGVGLYAKVVNRNKRSVTADLHTPLGVDIAKRLARDADVVVENFRPGTLERWGLGYDELSRHNKGLVMVRVSGFGQTGPYSPRAGFGTLAEAYAGFAYINGEAAGPPLLPAFGLADSTAGLTAAFLTLAALRERDRSGLGQVIDLAIYEPLLTLLGPQVIDYDQLGIVQQREGSRLPFTSPRNTFRTKDRHWVAMSGSSQSTFVRLCDVLGISELVDDPRFADNRTRLVHSEPLHEELAKAIATIERDDLLAKCIEIGAAVAPVNSVADVIADPHVCERGNIVAVEDDELDRPIRMQGVVGRFSRTPGEIRSAGPRVGEHNREILVDRLGFDPDKLRDGGIDVS